MKLIFEGTWTEIVDQMRSVLPGQALSLPPQASQAVPEDRTDEIENVGQPEDQGPGPETEVEAPPALDRPKNTSKTSKNKPKKAEGAEKAQAVPDPAKLVAIRQQTIEDLQTAYSDGKQKQVFDLLAKHGGGAKSFRELAPESFLPIREAIDAGALA